MLATSIVYMVSAGVQAQGMWHTEQTSSLARRRQTLSAPLSGEAHRQRGQLPVARNIRHRWHLRPWMEVAWAAAVKQEQLETSVSSNKECYSHTKFNTFGGRHSRHCVTDPLWRLGLSDWVRLTLVISLWPFGPKRPRDHGKPDLGSFFLDFLFFRTKKKKIRTWNKKNESCRTTGTFWYRKPGTEKLYPLGPYPSFIQTLSCSHVLCSKPRSYHRGVGCGTKGDLTLSGRIHQVLTFGVPTFGLWGSCVISAMVLVRNHSEIFLEP